jgi:Zn-dependent protease
MFTQLLSNPLIFVYLILVFGFSLAIHEAAHAWMADRLGDPTAKLAGRLTINPLAHLDPLGTLMLFVFHFGWGKPVPIDEYNLQKPRQDAGLISLAGPSANLTLAAISAIVFRLTYHVFPLTYLLVPIVEINVSWALFNLLPIHPLDGGKILVGLLPAEPALRAEEFLQQYQLIFLLLIIFPFFGNSLVNIIIDPIANFLLGILLPAASLI